MARPIAATSSVRTWATASWTGAPLPIIGMPRARRWGDDGVVDRAAQGEDGGVDGGGGELGDGALGVVERAGRRAASRGRRLVELLGEAVEHAEGERVAEGVQQRPLDDDGDGARPAAPQRGREGVRARHTPSSAAAARTRSAVASATGPLPLKTSEAVEVETPARRPRRAASDGGRHAGRARLTGEAMGDTISNRFDRIDSTRSRPLLRTTAGTAACRARPSHDEPQKDPRRCPPRRPPRPPASRAPR